MPRARDLNRRSATIPPPSPRSARRWMTQPRASIPFPLHDRRIMRRSQRARGGRTLIGALLIGWVGPAPGGFALAGFLLRAPPTDPDTLCRTDAPPAAHTLILVDSTDRLERRHRRRLDALALQERARLGHYD